MTGAGAGAAAYSCRNLRSLDVGDEPVDLGAQLSRVARQLAGSSQQAAGHSAAFRRGLLHLDDVGGDLPGAVRGLRDAAAEAVVKKDRLETEAVYRKMAPTEGGPTRDDQPSFRINFAADICGYT